MLQQLRYNKVFNTAKRQQGVVLVTALLILLIIMILAAAAFKTSFIQTLTANNFRFQKVSFNNAESMLRDAENEIEEIVETEGYFNFENSGNRYYSANQTLDLTTVDWDNIISDNDSDDKFIIHYQGRQQIPGEDEAVGAGTGKIEGAYVYMFLVTARSLTPKGAERVIQSVYVTAEQP